MRAVLCRDFSGPDHLELGEAPEPQPAEDEILIDVHAASVTYMDLLLVSGGYQMRPPTPFVPVPRRLASWSVSAARSRASSRGIGPHA